MTPDWMLSDSSPFVIVQRPRLLNVPCWNEDLSNVVEDRCGRKLGRMQSCETHMKRDNLGQGPDPALMQFNANPHCIAESRVCETPGWTGMRRIHEGGTIRSSGPSNRRQFRRMRCIAADASLESERNSRRPSSGSGVRTATPCSQRAAM